MSTLRKAMATYVHSRSYQIAIARADSMRHDIDGEPVGPISDGDRLDALRKYEGFKARDGSSEPKSALPAQLTKTEAIRMALLRRKENPR